jgi:hypothetical protein
MVLKGLRAPWSFEAEAGDRRSVARQLRDQRFHETAQLVAAG